MIPPLSAACRAAAGHETMDKKELLALQAEWESAPETEAKLPNRLPLKSLVLRPAVFQCRSFAHERTGLTEDGKGHVAAMATELKASPANDLDAVTIIRIGGRNILVDGHHRLAAYKNAKRPDIPVEYFIHPGGPKAVVHHVGKENRKTKLTMTSGERAEWAWRLVRSQLYTKAEERAASGVSDGTIGNMRRVLRELQASGADIPDLWYHARPKAVHDHESASAQAQEWAAKLTQTLGPSKTFNTLGKKVMLAEALRIWSPRIADELVTIMAEDADLTARVEALHDIQVAELGEERLDQLVNERADALLQSKGYVLAVDGVRVDF